MQQRVVVLPLALALFASAAACSPSGEATRSRRTPSTRAAKAGDALPTPPPAAAHAAATAAADEAASDDDEPLLWMTDTLGPGVAYTETQNPAGRAAAVFYAGYHADLAGAEAWAAATYRAALRERGVRYIWAIQGPSTPNYADREIGNAGVAAALARVVAAGASYVLIVAHSSGTFVAHELLAKVATDKETASKVVYFDLDGAAWGLSAPIVSRLRKTWFVGVRDGDTNTTGFNAGTMKAFGTKYAAGGGFLEVDASSAGCRPGARECVHMALVNARPHDASSADVAADYHGFDDAHPPATGWLEMKADESGVVSDADVKASVTKARAAAARSPRTARRGG